MPVRGKATSYTDFYKKNDDTPASDTELSDEDARKLAIKRRLEKSSGKTVPKATKPVKLMR